MERVQRIFTMCYKKEKSQGGLSKGIQDEVDKNRQRKSGES